MNKIRKDDKVIVITGKDKGKTGVVKKVMLGNKRGSKRVLIEGVNIVKKHVRPNPQKNQQGGMIDVEASIHISNVALLNPVTGKADRIGIKILDDGRKVRYFKSNHEIIDVK